MVALGFIQSSVPMISGIYVDDEITLVAWNTYIWFIDVCRSTSADVFRRPWTFLVAVALIISLRLEFP